MITQRKSAFADAKNSMSPPVSQVAALCHRSTKKGQKVLLITSSNGRWIFPKGWPIEGKTDAQAAMQEAWEEAGVRKGDVANDPVASYVGTKTFDDNKSVKCETTVYAIEVTDIQKDFPEAEKRDRKWVALEEAKELVAEDGMREALERL